MLGMTIVVRLDPAVKPREDGEGIVVGRRQKGIKERNYRN